MMFIRHIKIFASLEKTLNFKQGLPYSSGTWDLASSICLERKPVLTKELNGIESKYSETLSKVEYELSYKSDHEIRLLKDKMYAEESKKSDSFINADNINLQTGQEFEDSSENELKAFKFALRTTEADKKNDMMSTERKLKNSLLLLIKQKLGNTSNWVMPLGIRQDGETMRQAAERVLVETCGTDIQAKFMGNAPVGFYKYRYPKSANLKQSVGMKIFFFKAQLLSGNVSKEVCSSFQWITHNEMDQSVIQEDYYKNIRMFLLDDEEQRV